MRRSLLTFGLAAVLSLGAGLAGAQGPAAFPQEQIEAVAAAAVEMRRLHEELGAQVRAAEDGDEIARVQQQAMAEEIRIVEANGLTPDEYKAIVAATQHDPELRATIVALMQEREAR